MIIRDPDDLPPIHMGQIDRGNSFLMRHVKSENKTAAQLYASSSCDNSDTIQLELRFWYLYMVRGHESGEESEDTPNPPQQRTHVDRCQNRR